jgi:hypothetical protein
MSQPLDQPARNESVREPDRGPVTVAPEALRKGLIETHVSRPVAWTMIAVFLLIVYGVPAVQIVGELSARKSPQLFALFHAAPAKAHLREWEETLSRVSIVKNLVQPLLQAALSDAGGFGNTQTVIGRDGWLYYRPGIDYVGGPGFLEARHFAAQRRKAIKDLRPPPQPDPRVAIREFCDECARFGARLVIVPVPDKAMLQPGELSRRMALGQSAPPLNNPDFSRFVDELRASGVDVFDPTPTSIAPGEEWFLAQDTHWTPGWMQHVAGELARYVRDLGVLPEARPGGLKVEQQSVRRVGDLVDMLKLTPDQEQFPAAQVQIRRVVDARTEGPWRADPQAALLLLGDSFTNIYSFAEMGWGDSAGFAEQLSESLGIPIDRISRNDAGAFATRQMLAAEMAKGRNRLAGKKVVVWQFAMRELAVGDWKEIPLKLGAAPDAQCYVPAAGAAQVVTGTVREIARAPRPGTVPYKDHIIAVHLVDLAGESGLPGGGEALVYVWSMRDNESTRAASWRVDQMVRLRLRPWSDVADRWDAINRQDLDNDELNLQEPCWGEEPERE